MRQFYETYEGNEKVSPLVSQISWTIESNNTKVATVATNGEVTASGNGTAKITTNLVWGDDIEKSFTTTVTVK